MQLTDKLNEIFKKNDSNILRNLFLLGLLGIVLLLVGNIFTSTDSGEVEKEEIQINKLINDNDSYIDNLSTELAEILSVIRGVGEVKVQLLVNEGIAYEYEYNKNKKNKITNETDRDGGEREIKENTLEDELVIIKDASGNEEPVIRVEKKPKITGVIIVARGAEVSEIKYDIYKTVSRFLDLPLHKINVLPYERR